MLDYIFLNWRPALEILILWFIFYRMLVFFEGSRAVNVLRGIIILIIAFFVSQKLGLLAIEWLLTKLFAFWLIAIIVIFQPELRHGLARLGQQHLFYLPPKEEELDQMIKELVKAIRRFSYEHVGAIIALERQQKLRTFTESGVQLDSIVSTELLHTIFAHGTPLHDGGVVITGNRIVAAACLFPLTQQQGLSPVFGTRHRAAIGLSEETDAVVIVVSEERGEISLALNGRLNSKLEIEKLDSTIKNLLYKQK
ncbi:MAG: diadenylate cyclase CdaA [Candidatus Omnitrophota bacterium]